MSSFIRVGDYLINYNTLVWVGIRQTQNNFELSFHFRDSFQNLSIPYDSRESANVILSQIHNYIPNRLS